MKIEHTHIYGFENSFRGLRNPFESWDKGDSLFGSLGYAAQVKDKWPEEDAPKWISLTPETPFIGLADLKLAKKLIKNGTDHRKFLRQIQIWADLTVPRYVWTEIDTYKVATVRNSCSTMHKLGHTDFKYRDFEDGAIMPGTIVRLNELGTAYRNGEEIQDASRIMGYRIFKGYDIVRYMKSILPESFLQKATYTMSYETALSMYFARRNHLLPQWNEKNPDSICSWIISLPYMKEFASACS